MQFAYPQPDKPPALCFSVERCNCLRDKSPNCIPEPILSGFIWPASMQVRMERAHLRKASSTFSPLNALHSTNIKSKEQRKTDYWAWRRLQRYQNYLPFSFAKLLASSKVTSRCASRSLLLPTRMMMMLGLAKLRASVSQFCKELNDSRLKESRDKS